MKTLKMIATTAALATIVLVGSQALAFDRGDYRPAVYVTGASGSGEVRSEIQPAHYYGRRHYGHGYYGRYYGGHRPYYGGGYYPYYQPYYYGGYPYSYPRPYYYGYPFFGLSFGIPPFYFNFGF